MITGGAYICVAIALSLISLLVRRSAINMDASDEVFSYSPIWGYAMIFCAIAIMLLGVFLCFGLTPRPQGLQIVIMASVLTTISSFFLYGYRYIKDFEVRLTDSGLNIRYVFTTKFIPYSSIAKIVMLHGGKGEKVLEILNSKNKIMIKLSSSLDNLEALCGGVRSHSLKSGAVYRRRDMFGNWS